MHVDVEAALKALRAMTVTQLRERYAEVFGEATRSHNKPHLVKRIIWRLQAIREGGLSERALRRAKELANDADLRIRPPAVSPNNGDGPIITTPFRVGPDSRLPMPGTLLRREYKGQVVQVRVLPKGFEFDGEVYRSLTAIALKVTGCHWNGFHFFRIGADTPKEKAS